MIGDDKANSAALSSVKIEPGALCAAVCANYFKNERTPDELRGADAVALILWTSLVSAEEVASAGDSA